MSFFNRRSRDPGIEQLRMAVYDNVVSMQDRIGDLEKALKDASIPIPHGFEQAEREKRIKKGEAILRGQYGWDI